MGTMTDFKLLFSLPFINSNIHHSNNDNNYTSILHIIIYFDNNIYI